MGTRVRPVWPVSVGALSVHQRQQFPDKGAKQIKSSTVSNEQLASTPRSNFSLQGESIFNRRISLIVPVLMTEA
jgi:hypothetical protein